MRLTLRTLLAYLDDTLEPSQAKIIGQKVAESDQARELMEHIKQVTRRRRITTPPANGAGGKFDPNTIAEYLDGAVTAEQAGEVEQVCLESDVHLAEVAACHQILALVLGEPALVPPTAKMRMYGLVKGPESIPFRKPVSLPSLSGEYEALAGGEDPDETLRMGLPSVKASGRGLQFLLLVSACIAAASLLALAIYHVLNPSGSPDQDQPSGHAQVQTPVPGADKQPVPPKVEPKPKELPGVQRNDNQPKPKSPDDFPPLPPPSPDDGKSGAEPTPREPPLLPEYRFFEPDDRPVRLGKYVSPTAKDPISIVVSRPLDGGPWKRLWGTQNEVQAGRTYVALPGCRGELQLDRGVQLTLWGNIPEILPAPPQLFESVVDLHSHDAYDVDLTLQRGRILLTSTKDKPAIVRVRIENPAQPKTVEIADLALQGKGSQVLIDRAGAYPPGVPFVKDPTSTDRLPPAAFLGFWVMKGNAAIRFGDTSPLALSAPPGKALMTWNSLKGLSPPQKLDVLPDVVSANPPPPQGVDKKVRAEILKARDDLSQLLANNGVDVRPGRDDERRRFRPARHGHSLLRRPRRPGPSRGKSQGRTPSRSAHDGDSDHEILDRRGPGQRVQVVRPVQDAVQGGRIGKDDGTAARLRQSRLARRSFEQFEPGDPANGSHELAQHFAQRSEYIVRSADGASPTGRGPEGLARPLAQGSHCPTAAGADELIWVHKESQRFMARATCNCHFFCISVILAGNRPLAIFRGQTDQ